MEIPQTDNEFLSSIVTAIRKRRKAIRYKFAGAVFQKVYDVHENYREEKLELIFPTGYARSNEYFSFNFWEDRWFRGLAYCHDKQGTHWRWEYEGRLFPNLNGRELVHAIEDCCTLTPADVSETTKVTYLERVRIIWEPKLGTGPTVVKD